MDEGRKNFLTYQIISGHKFININNCRYKLTPSSNEIKLLAEHIYMETIDNLKFDTLITKKKMNDYLRTLKIWDDSDDEALKKLETHLDDRKVDLYHSLLNAERQVRLRRAIKVAKNNIEKAYTKKHSLEHITVNYHAFLAKKRFIIALCLRDDQNNPIYNEKTLLEADSTILEKVLNFLDSDIITVEEFRELARNDPWRTLWSVGKDRCLSGFVSEWTDDQKMLVTFSKMYDNAHQSTEPPPDEVFDDDDMFDGWMIDQRRKREKEVKQKQADVAANIPDNAQEVFLYAPTREDADKIYDLNDEDSRVTIKKRQDYIQHFESVQAQDLPDTKLELRRQQIEEYKQKMRKG